MTHARAHVALVLALALVAGCAAVLGIRSPGRRPFEHRQHAVAGVACATCHAGVKTAGDEGPLHVPGTKQCVECHTKPHDAHDCGNCHGTPAARGGAALARTDLRFSHQKHLPRTKGECVRCHVDVKEGAAILRPSMATCGSCHEHQGQIEHRACDACHVDLGTEGTMPDDHLAHGPDWMRQHGTRAGADAAACATCHSERSCTSCHGKTVPALPARMAFDDPTRASVHRAGFLSRHPEEARGDPGLCSTCHAPESCASCHLREGVDARSPVPKGVTRRSPHPADWLGLPGSPNEHGRAAWRDPAQCASCHGGAGEALCVGCHKVGGVGGNPHAPGFKSTKKKQVDRPCALCHGGAP